MVGLAVTAAVIGGVIIGGVGDGVSSIGSIF